MPIAAKPDALHALLREIFGHTSFRASQEEVCRTAVGGRDLLLVMPTGAGKSLCYQLPAVALGGTALVISPLIALMEDQVAKLAALGLNVARIHSGLDRADSREACVRYLKGELNYLFIAPERLRVPGFPEMLGKRKPALIAIDEAHCISQWGHDFRPDYRMIGQYIPALRPAVVVALTATATPAVQADIVNQLDMNNPALFIHGFRRRNLAIEVVELPIPERLAAISGLLTDKSRRPAIVYATSRKSAESLAEELSRKLPAAAYHAGLEPEQREHVQTRFLKGELDVVVATIAFGMGIDKADIRTVIHAGLPSTLEGYYQEIGRAGRDGKPSRTYLMHSYADQRTQDFFLARDYPPSTQLEQIFKRLTADPQPVEDLRQQVRLGNEEFDKALEKLEIHGGARIDYSGGVTRGVTGWKKTYDTQARFRAEQFDKVVRFTDGAECRMGALVRHFGDEEDADTSCGICDICDPAGAVLRQFRRADASERAIACQIADELRMVSYKAAGTVQRMLEATEDISRASFDAVLDAMVRAGLLAIEDAEFEKDGETRRYRKLSLTDDGLRSGAVEKAELLLADGVAEAFAHHAGPKVKKGKSKMAKEFRGGGKQRRLEILEEDQKPLSREAEALAGKIKIWRSAEAKRLGVPPYIVLHDRALRALAQARPENPNQLLEVDGIGPAKLERFGDALLELCSAG